MVKALGLVFLLALTGCSAMAPRQYAGSPCVTSPGGYECQVDRYFTAP